MMYIFWQNQLKQLKKQAQEKAAEEAAQEKAVEANGRFSATTTTRVVTQQQ